MGRVETMNWNRLKSGITLFSAVILLGSNAALAGAQGVPSALKPAAGHNASLQVSAVSAGQAVRTAAVSAKASNNAKPAVQANPVPGIISSVTPSVVGIIGEAASGGDNYGDDDDYGDYGNYDDYSTNSTGSTGGGADSDLAHGTGIIIKANGWIITNAHVIDGIDDPTVVTSNGSKYKIEQSYIDELSDLALIHINASGLKPAVLAPASRGVRVGDKVIALGTPVSFALRGSATEGIVSGLNRSIDSAYKMIQTDAAINPGNSGGPLLNMQGEVIGVNAMKYEAVGVESLGFSIPIATVHYVVDQLFKYGEVERPSLGLSLKESDSSQAGIPGNDPLTVVSVDTAGAKKAGFKAGDKIYKVNNTNLTSLADLNELMKSFKPGQTVAVWTVSKGDIVKRTVLLTKDSGDYEGKPEDNITPAKQTH